MGHCLVRRFMEAYPESAGTDVKKLGIVHWQTREMPNPSLQRLGFIHKRTASTAAVLFNRETACTAIVLVTEDGGRPGPQCGHARWRH